ncbi:MAG: hypothetical protein LLF83_01240 [Methanobacterium sp.]|nr:hypothetical protein [Methanobacterium sp.]
MFGLTKRQFLKKSKIALQQTGVQLLSLRGLMNQKSKGEISLREAQRNLDTLRKHVENTFSIYEKLNPPSKCLPLQQKIFNALIIFHSSLVSYSESLNAAERGLPDEADLKLKSAKELNKYQELTLSLSREIDSYLKK